jgi:hypothetical protein
MKFFNRTLLLAFFVLGCLQAQDITKGTIAGVVRDASGAVVPEAAVKLTSPYGDRSTTSNGAGEYSFHNLVVGPGYNLTIQQPGFVTSTARNLTVGINQQTNYDFNLQVGTAAQSVDVSAQGTAIDLSTTTIGANLDENLYKNVPIGRNISSVMSMAPGVADSDGAGSANPSINGASGLENEYIINGANTTDPGFGGFGTYSRVYGPLGNGINFDFVQEVQVQTGGFEAQYGQALGGVVNVVTKSGTNQFHGDVFAYFQPQQFEATRNNANPLLVSKTDYLVHQGAIDYGADAGGYFLKDKLFWYAGFNPLYNHTYKEADPSYANYALGVVDREIKTYDYTAKIDYNLGSKHQLEGSVFGDPSSTPMTFNSNLSTVLAPAPVDDTVESRLKYGTRTWTGRYNGTMNPNWNLTVNYSNYYNNFTETPLANGYQVQDSTAVEEGTGGAITYGGIGFIEGSESKVNQLAVSSTHLFRFLGGHTLQLGYQFEDDVYNDIQKYTGASFNLPNDPALGAAAGQTVYGAAFTRQHQNVNDLNSPIVLVFTRGNYSNPAVATDTRYQSGYIQDTWTFGRLSIKPGLRFEQQSMLGNQQAYVFGHNWAPRVGVILDPFNDRKTKVYASWGRFYEKIPLDISVREFSLQTGLTGALYGDPGSGNQPNLSPSNYIPGGNIALQGVGGLTPIAGGTGAQFQDEVVGGIEHEFAHNLTFTGRFVYRDLRRILEDTSGINVTQALAGVPQQYVVANPSRALDIYQNANPCSTPGVGNCINYNGVGYTAFANGTNNPFGSDGVADGFPNPSRIYKSMELIVSKRFTKLQFYGSYVLSKLYGNYQGNFRSDNFQQDPNISSMFDFTNSDGVLTGQDIPGVLPSDRRHQFKFFGNYQIGNFSLGLGWTPTSGSPITDLLDHPAYKNAGEIPVCPDGTFTCSGGPRGAEGRTDWVFPFNVHGEYTIRAGERARIKFVADLFNLFNQQTLVRVNQFGELGNSPGVPNPDFLKPYLSGVPVVFPDPYQDPFSARLAVRFEF